jgi:Zn-finger protein
MACPQCNSILSQDYYEWKNENNDLAIVWTCRNCKIQLTVHYPAEHAHIIRINESQENTTMKAFTDKMRKEHLKMGIVTEHNIVEAVEEETKKNQQTVPKGFAGLGF